MSTYKTTNDNLAISGFGGSSVRVHTFVGLGWLDWLDALLHTSDWCGRSTTGSSASRTTTTAAAGARFAALRENGVEGLVELV